MNTTTQYGQIFAFGTQYKLGRVVRAGGEKMYLETTGDTVEGLLEMARALRLDVVCVDVPERRENVQIFQTVGAK